MNLKEFLKQRKMTARLFSKQLGVTEQHLSEIQTGRKRAGKPLSKLIMMLTGGLVTINEISAEIKDKEVL
jgi:transcriptional regulator with XRE-family HTH domain